MIYTTDIIGDQWKILIGAVELGLVIGGCYDILRVLRVAFSFGKRLYILSDYVFCLWGGFLTFSFLLNENYGIPRLYIFLGEKPLFGKEKIETIFIVAIALSLLLVWIIRIFWAEYFGLFNIDGGTGFMVKLVKQIFCEVF